MLIIKRVNFDNRDININYEYTIFLNCRLPDRFRQQINCTIATKRVATFKVKHCDVSIMSYRNFISVLRLCEDIKLSTISPEFSNAFRRI